MVREHLYSCAAYVTALRYERSDYSSLCVDCSKEQTSALGLRVYHTFDVVNFADHIRQRHLELFDLGRAERSTFGERVERRAQRPVGLAQPVPATQNTMQ